MHKSQNLFSLTTALHVSGVTITHRQEHKTTVTTASGNSVTCASCWNLILEEIPVFPCIPQMFTLSYDLKIWYGV